MRLCDVKARLATKKGDVIRFKESQTAKHTHK
jgi:hypothetical protein